MQLIYRGNKYDYNSSMFADRPFEMVRNPGSAYDLIYRGIAYRVGPSAKHNEVAVPVESHKLIYRGVIYFKSGTVQKEVIATPKLEIAA